MNIHEYQARELLQKFDVATTRGKVAATLDEAEQIARELGDVDLLLRRKFTLADVGKELSKTDQGRRSCSENTRGSAQGCGEMLDQILVTHQTGRVVAL